MAEETTYKILTDAALEDFWSQFKNGIFDPSNPTHTDNSSQLLVFATKEDVIDVLNNK